jgi:hypothetical protein
MPQAMNARAVLAVGAALVVIPCMDVQAALLLPDGGYYPVPAEPDPTGGTIVGSLVNQPFSSPAGTGHFSGLLSTTVIKDDPSNPYANIGDPDPTHHGLTFVYQVSNDPTSATSLERMTDIDFSGFATDVSYVPAGGLVAPSRVDRSTGLGTTVGWDFDGAPVGLGKISPGSTTDLLVIQTNASQFLPTTANLIDGSIVTVSTFGPDITVIEPEPSSLALIVLGGLGFAAKRRNS